MDRLEKLKLNSIENPGKKKRGCSNCKKAKEVVVENLPLPFEMELNIPSIEEAKTAYIMLGNPKPEEKVFINQVFFGLFNKTFDWNCPSCVHTHTQILKNYLKDLGIKL
jgi:hypothetical protein